MKEVDKLIEDYFALKTSAGLFVRNIERVAESLGEAGKAIINSAQFQDLKNKSEPK